MRLHGKKLQTHIVLSGIRLIIFQGTGVAVFRLEHNNFSLARWMEKFF